MRLSSFSISFCCLILLGILSVDAQTEDNIRYEVVTFLEIPGVESATWSPDGSRLAIKAWPTIQIWDTEQWQLLNTIPNAFVYSAKWSPNGELLAGVGGGQNENVVIWDATTGELLRTIIRPRPADLGSGGIIVVHDLAWHPNGRLIATDSGLNTDEYVLTWDLGSENNPQSLVRSYPNESFTAFVNIANIEWSPSGRWLLTSGGDGNFRSRSIIRLYDATSGVPARTIFPGFFPIWSQTDEQFAGLGMSDGDYTINIWEVETGEVISSINIGDWGLLDVAWNFDTNALAGIGLERPLIVWRVATGESFELESLQPGFGVDVEWRPNSNQLAIVDMEQGVTIVNFEFTNQ